MSSGRLQLVGVEVELWEVHQRRHARRESRQLVAGKVEGCYPLQPTIHGAQPSSVDHAGV
jgi:hypothetical protein